MMSLNDAVKIFKDKYPGYRIVGYWVKKEGYIFNVKSFAMFKGLDAPGQFVVTRDGDIYGTNPMTSNLSIEDMKKYK